MTRRMVMDLLTALVQLLLPCLECMSPGTMCEDLNVLRPKFVLLDCLTKIKSAPELLE